MSHYVELIDIREDGKEHCYMTGKGVAGKYLRDTRRLFEMARPYEKPFDDGAFLVDLHVRWDLVDTIVIDEDGYRALMNEEPPTHEECVRYDAEYHEQQRLKRPA